MLHLDEYNFTCK